MRWVDSRRLTGRNWLTAEPGAAIEVRFDPGEDVAAAIATWQARAELLADSLEWPPRTFRVRHYVDGATLAMTCPRDRLGLGTSVLEWAAEAEEPNGPRFLRILEGNELDANPALLTCLAQAAFLGLPYFHDDEGLTVGLGAHGRTWPLTALPDPAILDTLGLGPIPVVGITGTNGKTTTTRFVAAMAKAGGYVAGSTSSDEIRVGDEIVDQGDWSGPYAARRLLRDLRVTFAVLETARGGMLRRGLALDAYDVVIVTNVSDDHFGEFGIDDLDTMADAKLLLAEGLRPGGVLVANADNTPLVSGVRRFQARRPDVVVRWFADRADRPALTGWADKKSLHLDKCHAWMPLGDIPLTIEGRARHNVENALAAAIAALSAGVPEEAVKQGLRDLTPDPTHSRGRTNLFRIHGVTVLVDFAHNPDGLRQLARFAQGFGAVRTLLAFGQAGDRTDALIDRLGDVAAEVRADAYIVKDLADHRRGRNEGEVPQRLVEALLRGGIAAESIQRAGTDVDALEKAMAWARPGDLVLMLTHEQIDEVTRRLGELGTPSGAR